MHFSLLSAAVLAVTGTVVAAPQGNKTPLAPKLPISAFNTTPFHGISLKEAQNGPKGKDAPAPPESELRTGFSTQATCTNPRVRTEWDNYSNADKQRFVDALKCLMRRPSGGNPGARNRFEDLVQVHQQVTPNVHRNHKFLIWHRYYLHVFETILREECGFTANLPWFDERKYAGRFAQSSVFSNQWFGAIAINGNCVTNGQFANLALNIGPGAANRPHCLARNGDGSKTANTNDAMVQACNSRNGYANMASCAEGGAHAWGHNGIGATMQDVYASPGDPVFWLHHAFIDRNFRIWQNAVASRKTTIDGTDVNNNPLTLDTQLWSGLRGNLRIRNVLDTMGDTLCYRYDY